LDQINFEIADSIKKGKNSFQNNEKMSIQK